MLNIVTRVSLSKASKKTINSLTKKKGSLTVNSWSTISKRVKNEISKKLSYNQRGKCAYCERYLFGLGHEIDHFAHKALYPRFTFVTVNLYYSCSSCNSTARKGQKATVLNLQQYYKDCTFLIVHPFFNNPDDEIKFIDEDKVVFDRTQSTELGRNTIDFFKWDDFESTTIRARTLMFDRLSPLVSDEERKLISEIVTYKN
ncbi:retron system putative HNH endonuclease [Olivibacter jilunii]|uniref:retron system putative HNH endonuclease n=1 Tax=Olivibacter jilunii TaxID=985016 RepID=UPI00103080D2|nr:retron system putative HNH endonuclease [Olivibacter jilunii]